MDSGIGNVTVIRNGVQKKLKFVTVYMLFFKHCGTVNMLVLFIKPL
jgi:hypothetical protein